MRSVKYLEQVKTVFDLKTDAALAAKLGVGKSAISHYMKGLRVMDEETCVSVAMVLDLNEHQTMQLIIAAGMDRAEKSGQKSLWEVFTSRMAAPASALLAVLAVNLFVTPSSAEAAPLQGSCKSQVQTVYIM